MANSFGGFLHTSPLSNLTSSTSRPPDPHVALSSNCVRDHLGPVVQSVSDALHSRGPSTLSELTSTMRERCMRDWNRERGRLVDGLLLLDGGTAAGSAAAANDNARRPPHTTTTTTTTAMTTKVSMNKARGPESAGFVVDPSRICAALVVLLRHSLVDVSGGGGGDPASPRTRYTYTFLPDRARLLMRHSRYVQHVRDVTTDERASAVVECLLLNGRMTAEDVVRGAWGTIGRRRRMRPRDDDDDDGRDGADDNNHGIDVDTNNDDYDNEGEGNVDDVEMDKALRGIVRAFVKLVEWGYVEAVKPIARNRDLDRGDKNRNDGTNGAGEFEFGMDEDGTIVVEGGTNGGRKRSAYDARESNGEGDERPTKKRAIGLRTDDDEDGGGGGGGSGLEGGDRRHHPRILSLLSSQRGLVPRGSVYRANTSMFHASLRAMAIGRLVSEMYPDEGDGGGGGESDGPRHAGAVVRAALMHAAREEHAPGVEESEEGRHGRMAGLGTFSPPDLVPYLPQDVIGSLRSQIGGIDRNLTALLVRMSKLRHPPVLLEVEEARGHPRGGKFEVCTRQLLRRMRDRIQHRVLSSHHGVVAARVVSVLRTRGHCESDVVAEDAMVPAREAREVLHRLHRDRYVDLFDMHMTKTHNTGTAIFLWDVIPSRLSKTVIDNVGTALLNLRLRRQHEVEVGKDWMDRAKESGATEENFHEGDKRKFHKFCMGLDRLDRACLSLDETLMVLKDF
ncbi:hypothetical protein ACHAW5_005607 [Stephanodiscus triporus]|uniref:DNA-directed RNA polymerase III subunit RPC3 n=1 Tax=Stephanodiscus triporus TaxID=2934178 RepID=A0ABD3R0I9_9STRA